jgi:hypothetical protein
MKPTPLTVAMGIVVAVSLSVMYVLAFVVGADPLPKALVAIVAVLAAAGATLSLRSSLPVRRPRAVDVITGASSTALSLLLTRELGVPALVAAGLVAVCLGVAALDDGPLDAMSSAAGYAGAFVGLLTPAVTLHPLWVVTAGFAAGFLWSLIGLAVFPGIGGRMGVVAYMAASSIYVIADLFGDEVNGPVIPPVDGMAHMAVIPIGGASALVTWALLNRAGWGFCMASGLSTLLVCGGVAVSGLSPSLQAVLGPAWFGGTFVAGTTTARLPSAAWIGLAGLLYGAFMLHFEGPLEGHVGVIGATGTIACLAVIAVERFAARGVLAGRPVHTAPPSAPASP